MWCSKKLYFLYPLVFNRIYNFKDKTIKNKNMREKNNTSSIYSNLTHDFNFTYFYPSIHHVIIKTGRSISRWSSVDKCDPSCYIVDGYIHNRLWTSIFGILLIYEMFGITQRIKRLRNIRVNGKSSWSCICFKING